MVGVVQLVEHQIVALGVASSSLVAHPIFWDIAKRFATLGTTTVTDAVLVALITIVMFVIPLIINRFKKASWATEVKEDLGE